MTFNLDEDELKRISARMNTAAQIIKNLKTEDMLFGPKLSGSPPISTARMAADSITRRPLAYLPFVPVFDVVTSPWIVETKRKSKEKKATFWRRLWEGLTDLNPWPYSPIEFYDVEVPAIMIDENRHVIMCHPSLKTEIENAVKRGELG